MQDATRRTAEALRTRGSVNLLRWFQHSERVTGVFAAAQIWQSAPRTSQATFGSRRLHCLRPETDRFRPANYLSLISPQALIQPAPEAAEVIVQDAQDAYNQMRS